MYSVLLLVPTVSAILISFKIRNPVVSCRRARVAWFALLSCLFFAATAVAYAQFNILGPAPVSTSVAQQQIRTLLQNVNPANTQQTIQALFRLAPWYRELLDEELIAAWRRADRENLPPVIESLADPHLAAGIIEFSWRQQREATFTPAYTPMLGHLMARYADSAKPFLDDLLASSKTGQQAADLLPAEAEAVCRILIDMPDIGTWRKSALQILPKYRQESDALLNRDLHGAVPDRAYRATQWQKDLGTTQSASAAQSGAAAPTARGPASPPMQPRSSGEVTTDRPSLKLNPSGQPGAQARPEPSLAEVPLPSPPSSSPSANQGSLAAGTVTPPTLISKREPEYSAEARAAGIEGMVVLNMAVDADGIPRNLKVVQSLGHGLDEKAIEAVKTWRFHPGQKDGKPVAVIAQAQVNFVLLKETPPEVPPSPTQPAAPTKPPQQKAIPPELAEQSAEYLEKRLRTWGPADADAVLGVPTEHRLAMDDHSAVYGEVFTYSDPTSRYRQFDLTFDTMSRKLRAVRAYPQKITVAECTAAWGQNFDIQRNQGGLRVYLYRDRSISFIARDNGEVISFDFW